MTIEKEGSFNTLSAMTVALATLTFLNSVLLIALFGLRAKDTDRSASAEFSVYPSAPSPHDHPSYGGVMMLNGGILDVQYGVNHPDPDQIAAADRARAIQLGFDLKTTGGTI